MEWRGLSGGAPQNVSILLAPSQTPSIIPPKPDPTPASPRPRNPVIQISSIPQLLYACLSINCRSDFFAKLLLINLRHQVLLLQRLRHARLLHLKEGLLVLRPRLVIVAHAVRPLSLAIIVIYFIVAAIQFFACGVAGELPGGCFVPTSSRPSSSKRVLDCIFKS